MLEIYRRAFVFSPLGCANPTFVDPTVIFTISYMPLNLKLIIVPKAHIPKSIKLLKEKAIGEFWNHGMFVFKKMVKYHENEHVTVLHSRPSNLMNNLFPFFANPSRFTSFIEKPTSLYRTIIHTHTISTCFLIVGIVPTSTMHNKGVSHVYLIGQSLQNIATLNLLKNTGYG